MYELLTVSREIDETDMMEYLRPISFDAANDQEMAAAYPSLHTMSTSDMFSIMMGVEFLFFQNIEKIRTTLVGCVDEAKFGSSSKN